MQRVLATLVLRNVVRSQRVIAPGLLTLAVVVLVCSNGPQQPGETLAAAVVALLPVHTWLAITAAAGTDAPTREAYVAIVGVGRSFVAHVAAGVVLGAAATAAVVVVALASGVMDGRPTGAQWGAWACASVASIALGTAIGAIAAPPVVDDRGARVLVAVGLVAAALIVSPLLPAARHLGRDAAGAVLGPVLAASAATVLVAAGLLGAGALVATRRR